MGRNSKRKPTDAPAPKRSRTELLTLLEEGIDFLRASAAAYDAGMEHEGKRLAVTLRVLLHQTGASHALLEQLGLRARFAWHNTAAPIDPRNLIPTIPGLTSMQLTVGIGGRYVALLDNRPEDLLGRTKAFAGWWNDPVSRFPGNTWCRKDYIRVLANKEGGAHVDPNLDSLYEAIVRNNLLGWTYADDVVGEKPFEGNAVTAGVRQIAHEVLKTFDEQLAATLG
jgi:hypothetical protein